MFIFHALLQLRKNVLSRVEPLTTAQLNTIPVGHNNNIAWHIGHMVITQQLLCYARSGATSRIEAASIEKYRKGTNPKTWTQPVTLEELKPWVLSTAECFEEDYRNGVFKTYESYTTSTGVELKNIDDAIIFSYGHENMHFGNILTMLKSV